MFEIIDNTELTTIALPSNATPELIESTNNIVTAIKEMGKQSLLIGAELVKVRDSKSFLPAFPTIVDYGMQVFGFKKSSIYSFMKIADLFLDDSGNIKNKSLSGMSPMQLEGLTVLKDEQIDEMIYKGTINSDMPVKEIKAAVKAYKDEHKKPKKESQVKQSGRPENNTNEQSADTNESTPETKVSSIEREQFFKTLDGLSAIVFLQTAVTLNYSKDGIGQIFSTNSESSHAKLTHDDWKAFRIALNNLLDAKEKEYYGD